jgi:hypothetical protein
MGVARGRPIPLHHFDRCTVYRANAKNRKSRCSHFENTVEMAGFNFATPAGGPAARNALHIEIVCGNSGDSREFSHHAGQHCM